MPESDIPELIPGVVPATLDLAALEDFFKDYRKKVPQILIEQDRQRAVAWRDFAWRILC